MLQLNPQLNFEMCVHYMVCQIKYEKYVKGRKQGKGIFINYMAENRSLSLLAPLTVQWAGQHPRP